MSLALPTASWATSATLACPAVCATREVLLFTKKAPLRRGFLANRYFVVIVVSALLCAPIHRSAWNRYSPKFALRVALLLYHRLCWLSGDYGVSVTMHNLPLTIFFRSKDHRCPHS